MTDPHIASKASRRWDSIDAARGVAIVAMVIYHLSWDLSFLQLVSFQVVGDPAWNAVARTIAASFLVLAGIGLSLAHAQGLQRGPFLRRLVRVGGAALAVTLVTAFAFPESYIFFGILHAIAVGGVLALPFLRAPAWLVLACAALCFVVPYWLTDRAFDQPLLEWLGLGSQDPVTNDYVPVFPWTGSMLLGLVAARILLQRGQAMRLAQWRAAKPLTRGLAWAGRWSLPIYLVHQPVLLALLAGVLHLVGPSPEAQARPFLNQCRAQCTQANGNAALCETACTCMVARLREGQAFDRIAADRASSEDEDKVAEAAQICLRRDPS